MRIRFSRLIFALLPLVSLNAVAGGHELGNGGDANEIEFGMYAFAAYEALVKNPTVLPEISRELYREKLFASRFEATEEVLYDRFGKDRRIFYERFIRRERVHPKFDFVRISSISEFMPPGYGV
jgi:hypothetical protein